MAEDYTGTVAFAGVSNNDSIEDGKTYVDDFGVPYAMAHSPEVWDLYDVPYQPLTIVIDGSGRIARRIDGPVTYESLKEAIEGAL